MIKIFYTGSDSFNSQQTLSSKSLGGFISNTAVPNGVLNSLFSPLGLMEFYNNKKITNYIGLGLYIFFFNEEENYDKVNLKFNLSYNEDNEQEAEFFKDLFKYKIGLGPIGGDSTNGFYLEKITAGAKPYYMLQDFQDLKFDTEVDFFNITLNESGIGIWISRTFDPKLFKEKFNFDSNYWESNDKLPNLDFVTNLNIDFEGVVEVE